MFSKISVKGQDQHPLYTFLTHPETNPGMDGEITWNFEKFLAGRDGKIIARFSPRTLPDAEEVTTVIEKQLATEKGD
jgi:glutathione peroxidase